MSGLSRNKVEEAHVGGHLLALDPGSEKCGVAVAGRDGTILLHVVVPVAGLASYLEHLEQRMPCERVVLGKGTYSREIMELLVAHQIGGKICLVDETGTTLEARRRYFQDDPPAGWRRFVPRGLLTPNRPYDDYAAIILLERYVESCNNTKLKGGADST